MGKGLAVIGEIPTVTYLLVAIFVISLVLTSTADAKERKSAEESIVLVSFDVQKKANELDYLAPDDVEIKLSKERPGYLHIHSGVSKRWPNLKISHPEGKILSVVNKRWDLAIYNEITVDVLNLESTPLTVYLRVDSPMLANLKIAPRVTNHVTIPPHETRTLSTHLTRSYMGAPDLVGMQVLPEGLDSNGINPSRVTSLIIFTDRSEASKSYAIGTIYARGRYKKRPWEKIKAEDFFPFVDKYGQFKHDDWPGKIKSDDDLIKQKEAEAEAIKNNPRPTNWNRFGGWKDGPSHDATGHFYVKKVGNRWWLIDPDGKQFWSNGIDVIRADGNTIITERERYFEGLPDTTSPLYRYLTKVKDNGVARGYFKDNKNLQQFNYAAANLHRKYGENWEAVYPDIVHKRLSHLGINTIGLWSDSKLTSMQKTPYVDWIYYDSPKIMGKVKRINKMVDMWHPDFERNLKKAAIKLKRLKDDPWLIGIFVDNELPWGDGVDFTENALTAAKDQPAKKHLTQYFRNKYKTINALNEAWSSDFKNWDAFISTQETINKGTRFREDANDFLRVSAEHYYKTVREIIKSEAPDTLYLGSRLNGDYPIPSKAAAKYCDIVSYNLYRDSVDKFKIVERIDKPIIIGEFHFGADDRGVFGKGLRHAKDQEERKNKYHKYLESALVNTNIIGAHWFQYFDEMTTGRVLDSENFQIGLVSITDSIYINSQSTLY